MKKRKEKERKIIKNIFGRLVGNHKILISKIPNQESFYYHYLQRNVRQKIIKKGQVRYLEHDV